MRFLLIIVAGALLAGCYWHKKPVPVIPLPLFIPGTYVTYEGGNFYAAWDTLIIAPTTYQQNRYAVWRRSTFQHNLGNDFFPLQRVQSKWTGLYDQTSKVLRAIGQRPDISFGPDQNVCTLDGILYRRVQ